MKLKENTIIKSIQKLFIDDRFILILIFTNSLAIFLQGFSNLSKEIILITDIIDSIITLLFGIEVIVKWKALGTKEYFRSHWNKLDFVLIMLAFPALAHWFINVDSGSLSWLLIFRAIRVFKFFRFLKFIPEIDKLAIGIKRALKDSVLVFFGFVLYNFIISVFSCYMFKDLAPEYFANPVQSFYTTFRVFTVEGWYEIPELISERSGTVMAFFSKIYFMLILLTGGILGLSLVNSIFVDAMVSDNNEDLEKKIDRLASQVDEIKRLLQNDRKQDKI